MNFGRKSSTGETGFPRRMSVVEPIIHRRMSIVEPGTPKEIRKFSVPDESTRRLSVADTKEPRKLSVGECNFWLNLGTLIDKRELRRGSDEETEKITTWLQAILRASDLRNDNKKAKEDEKEGEVLKKKLSITEESSEPEKVEETESKILTIAPKESETPPEKCEAHRTFTNLTKKKPNKRKNLNNNTRKYFGPLFDISFNLPRASQQLERLMGSSVVRLTDRKYMLDLQKKIQDDYHDTLMKRISNRQLKEEERQLTLMLNPRPDVQKFSKVLFAAQSIVLAVELERERRMGKGPKNSQKKFKKIQSPFMRNRDKLKTTRAKNAEELLKQGKRWERMKVKMAEQERINETLEKKEREKMLENQTLYIFDPEKADFDGQDGPKFKNRKFNECVIDLKSFLLSEKDIRLMKRIKDDEERDLLKAQDVCNAFKLSVATPTALGSQEVPSFDERQENVQQELTVEEDNVVKDDDEDALLKLKKFEFAFRSDEAKKKQNKQASKKEEEDPQIELLKNAETVADLYAIADEIISNDARKNKLLKHIKVIKKSLKNNIALLKVGAQ